MKTTECEFEECESLPHGLIRTFELCEKHYKMILKDNKIRQRIDMDIPKDLNIIESTKSLYGIK